MTILDDAKAALIGTIGLAVGNADAVRYFPNSEPAFWRSFAAIAVIAPVDLLITGLQPRAADGEHHVLIELFTVSLIWVLYPAVMVFVTRLLRLQARYPIYVIAYNWSSVLIIVVLLPASVLSALTNGESLLAGMIGLASFGYAIWFSAFMARTTLQTTWSNAIAIIVLDVALSLAVSLAIFRIAGVA